MQAETRTDAGPLVRPVLTRPDASRECEMNAKESEMFDLDIWVAIDEQGDYGVGKDADEALQNYRDTIQDATVALRVVNLELKATGPKTTVVRGTVPDEVEGEIALTVAVG